MAVCFFDSWEVADGIGCVRASRILCYFCVQLVNALFTGSRMKRTISPTRNLHFCGFFIVRTCLVFTFFQPSCVHSSASTSSKNLLGPGFFKVDRQHHMNSYCRTDGCKVQSGMPTLFALQNHVSWQEIFQRLPGPVQRLRTGNVGDAWKQLGTF